MKYLRIANENDRIEVAGVLFKNGYTVKLVRKKKNGKSYEYYVGYESMDKDIAEGDDES